MKRFTRYTMTIGAICGLVLSGAAWADSDLEVTMGVVPAGASAPSVIKLPDAASARAQDASAFGLGTANQAHDLKGDLGRDFGQSVSETAQQQSHTPNLPPQSRRP
jgi:hypothetical protein